MNHTALTLPLTTPPLEDDQLLLNAAHEIASKGIPTGLKFVDGVLQVQILSGFFKSDGLTYLTCKDGTLTLHSRYDQKDEVFTMLDIVEVSKQWYEHSRNRCAVWETIPAEWAVLYKALEE